MKIDANELSLALLHLGSKSCFLDDHGKEVELSDVNQINWSGDSPLIMAVIRGELQCADLLIDNGAKINFQGENGRTALHHAASKGETAIIELLINGGADRHLLDDNGKTAADIAAQMGHTDIIGFLKQA